MPNLCNKEVLHDSSQAHYRVIKCGRMNTALISHESLCVCEVIKF